ncbi:tetratricopeptide repeat protein [Niabella insulamsoli]|uniref:tetratricopeptide repeat protein n=1 Tax=Niabella insulamsoli TaxID=3144874 RepID=UPI0031FC7426
MKKPQYLTILVAVVVLCLIWAFGKTKPDAHEAGNHEGHQHDQNPSTAAADVANTSFSIDSALGVLKEKLSQDDAAAVSKLESAASAETDNSQKLHHYHQLSQFWKDKGKAFIPYAWYTSESARLENSEKNLNFAGHLFLNNLQNVENGDVAKWMALQAKDLFERSLKINADNDSAKVGLGATYLFGGISNAPMEGISKIREVVEKDSTNIYAQMTLAMGSLMSGQTDKAKARLQTVTQLDPKNLQAILLLADVYEKQQQKQDAIKYYQQALPLVKEHPEMEAELKKRIKALKS